MASERQFVELSGPDSDFRLSFRRGHISLEDQRMLLLHSGALSSLRKELIDSLGIDRARGLITRLGYSSGQSDANMVRSLMPGASDAELLLQGPELHSLEGIVNVTPVEFNIDLANGRFYGEFIWEDSFEAEQHRNQFGLYHSPVCWMQTGYASGYTSALMKKFIVYKEVECTGQGDHHCKVIGKPAKEWGRKITTELSYFRPENVAEQIVTLQSQVEHLRYSIAEMISLGDLVGVSQAFRHTADLIEKAADSTVTVLLLGETGVGKEVFARALHKVSPRAKKPFIAVNCAAIPEELIESELFGVEKGAFTGAQRSRPGRFERANHGTLFLDELGELSPGAQAKVLRVLQEGEFERVGDTHTRSVDVRLIAATNVELEEAVGRGRFRSDLYYRLCVYPVRVPPLRERQEDIPLLVQRFLDKHNAKHGKRIAGVTPEAMNALQCYRWPGNIRELENIIERGVIIVQNGQYIEQQDLRPSMSAAAMPPNYEAATPPPLGERDNVLEAEREQVAASQSEQSGLLDALLDQRCSLDELEADLIRHAVDKADGNLSLAARMLGMTRPQLAYRFVRKGKPRRV